MASPTQKIYAALKGVEPIIKSMVLSGVYQMKEAAKDLATIGENSIRMSIGKKGSYKLYSKKGRDRMSSPPGTPPAAQQGEDLEPSIYSKLTSKANQNPATSEFGSTAPFAVDLEFGTAKMPARPFLLPARQVVAAHAGGVVARHLRIAYARSAKKHRAKTIHVDMTI